MEVIHVPFEVIRPRVRGRFNATTLPFPYRPHAIIRNPRLWIAKPERFALPVIMGSAPVLPYIATIPIARSKGTVISIARSLIRSGRKAEVLARKARIRTRDFLLSLRYLSERHDTVGNVRILPFILETENEERIKRQDARFFRRTDWWSKY